MIQNFMKTDIETIENIILSQYLLLIIFLSVSTYFGFKIILMKFLKHQKFYKEYFGEATEGCKTDLNYIRLSILLPTLAILFLSLFISIQGVLIYEFFAKDFFTNAVFTAIIIIMFLSYFIYCLYVYLRSLKHKSKPHYHYNTIVPFICIVSFLLILLSIHLCDFE